MRRATVIVLDGCGAGAAPDAPEFGDTGSPDTVRHVWDASGPIQAPMLSACGFFSACGIPVPPTGIKGFQSRFGRLQPLSKAGKDSITGHWEMMGVVLGRRFPTYPNGFPSDLISAFQDRIGAEVLGNRAASGTAIIAELGALHLETGRPIVYTSADSVFQIACHEARVPVAELYDMCEVARRLCVAPHDVQRVIARPFAGEPGAFYRTERRRDFPLEAPANLVDAFGDVLGVGVVPELFAGRGFAKTRRTQSNAEHEKALLAALSEGGSSFIFANFEDFDMLYGHRNDSDGFARCLEAFDRALAVILERLTGDDILLLTADHGNDPTDASTDHTREYAPAVLLRRGEGCASFGDLPGYSAVGATVASWLGQAWQAGQSLPLF